MTETSVSSGSMSFNELTICQSMIVNTQEEMATDDAALLKNADLDDDDTEVVIHQSTEPQTYSDTKDLIIYNSTNNGINVIKSHHFTIKIYLRLN